MTKTSTARCIFCGSQERLSREHVFPKWLQGYLPRLTERTTHEIDVPFATRLDGTPINKLTKGMLSRNGDRLSQRIRCVCKRCNGGWMSRLQVEAKSLIVPFLENRWPKFTDADAATVAAWVAMTVMVIERADPRTACVPADQRDYLMRHGEVPPGWFIGMVGYSSILLPNAAFHHGQYIIGPLEPGQIPGADAGTYYAQTTAFALGPVVFNAVSANHPSVFALVVPDPDAYAELHHLRSVWPRNHEARRAQIGGIDNRALFRLYFHMGPPSPWVP